MFNIPHLYDFYIFSYIYSPLLRLRPDKMAWRTRRSAQREGGFASANSALTPRSLLRGASLALGTKLETYEKRGERRYRHEESSFV